MVMSNAAPYYFTERVFDAQAFGLRVAPYRAPTADTEGFGMDAHRGWMRPMYEEMRDDGRVIANYRLFYKCAIEVVTLLRTMFH